MIGAAASVLGGEGNAGAETVVGGIYNRTWNGSTAYPYSTILGGDGKVTGADCQTIPADNSENESCF